MPSIAILGEVMIEMAPTPDGTFAMGVAGDTYNTACLMAGLGIRTSYLTSLGGGEAAETIRRHAVGRHVVLAEPGDDTAARPGLYMIMNDASGERSFQYWRDTSAARGLLQDARRLDRLLKALPQASAFFLSGITLALMSDESRTMLAGHLAMLREAGVTVIFDPNHRPHLWKGETTPVAAITQILPHVDIYLPGREEEEILFGCEDIKATVGRLGDAAPRIIVMKNGGGICSYNDDGKAGEVTITPAAKVVDTTGAGDTFNGGFIAAHLMGLDTPSAIAFAAEAAAEILAVRGGVLPAARIDLLNKKLASLV
ncbi:sugar kinase [Pseudokordiimonas caeni]|uniref:sugar kinase n=1 Tax=Pseudokordiimonas caeni TaxID=2997908 RepID=UPI00281149B6|nr:sugar kinase [Pseudokordiimonas caeni]